MNILPEELQAVLKKGLSDTFQREQIISEDERLRSLESAVQKNICTLHDLPPDDVIVSGRKDAPGCLLSSSQNECRKLYLLLTQTLLTNTNNENSPDGITRRGSFFCSYSQVVFPGRFSLSRKSPLLRAHKSGIIIAFNVFPAHEFCRRLSGAFHGILIDFLSRIRLCVFPAVFNRARHTRARGFLLPLAFRPASGREWQVQPFLSAER